jgi:hypothetical protein
LLAYGHLRGGQLHRSSRRKRAQDDGMGFLANSLDDVGLQFPAVGTAKEKSIAFESN